MNTYGSGSVLVYSVTSSLAPQLVSQICIRYMCLECRTQIQPMAIGTTPFAASILEMAVHSSAEVFALCC